MLENKRKNRQISVAEMAPHVHVFLPRENKVNKLVDWISNWILKNLKTNNILAGDFLPSKGDLACHIGVSLGTMQNVFRTLEDLGYVESKQRIGTYIKFQNKDNIIKLTSKRELAIEVIKKHIIDKHFNIGETLTSSRQISVDINIPVTTVRLAINNLVLQGILKKEKVKFVIVKTPTSAKIPNILTLVEKIAKHYSKYENIIINITF